VEPADGEVPTSAPIPPIDASAPAKTETATFALGCFWGPDAFFGITPGVVRTRVGYAGGTKKDPNYYDLSDHTETIQIDYDPARISYRQLLDIFWATHHPEQRSLSRQYKSIIFYHNDEQKKLALETKAHQEAELGTSIYTEIVPLSDFYLAETYHQKYRLQLIPELMKEFNAIYPNAEDFINSTAAARVNGYINGYGTPETLQKELSSLGLSPAANKMLTDIVTALAG
jgi:peptide-methionine (S)-S-oxide reductase